jgi:hypothetical protein
MVSCRIFCLKCKAVFNSPIQFGTAEAFFTSTLVGNMRFIADGEGFVGNDTV